MYARVQAQIERYIELIQSRVEETKHKWVFISSHRWEEDTKVSPERPVSELVWTTIISPEWKCWLEPVEHQNRWYFILTVANAFIVASYALKITSI